jgi:hypothetical protein
MLRCQDPLILAERRKYGGNTLLTNGWKANRIKDVTFSVHFRAGQITLERENTEKNTEKKQRKRKKGSRGYN